jgi:hypothetical protein
MVVSFRSPKLHINTQMALMWHANCVLTCKFGDLDYTVVQVCEDPDIKIQELGTRVTLLYGFGDSNIKKNGS